MGYHKVIVFLSVNKCKYVMSAYKTPNDSIYLTNYTRYKGIYSYSH